MPNGGRGVHPLGDAGAHLPPDRHARRRNRGPADRRDREGRALLPLRQSRRDRVRGPVALRRRPRTRTATSASEAAARTTASAPRSRAPSCARCSASCCGRCPTSRWAHRSCSARAPSSTGSNGWSARSRRGLRRSGCPRPRSRLLRAPAVDALEIPVDQRPDREQQLLQCGGEAVDRRPAGSARGSTETPGSARSSSPPRRSSSARACQPGRWWPALSGARGLGDQTARRRPTRCSAAARAVAAHRSAHRPSNVTSSCALLERRGGRRGIPRARRAA